MSQFRWADILEALDKPTGEDAAPEIDAPYLGASLEDGVLCHRWLDGTVLPVLSGGAGDDDDDSDDSDDEGSDDDDDDEGDGNEGDDDESTLTHKQMANLRRSSRQAARFRIAAKNERAAHVETTTERDDLKRELAFTRAADYYYRLEESTSLVTDFNATSGWILGDNGLVTWPIHYSVSPAS